MKKIGFLSFFLTFTLFLGAKTITISNISNVWAEEQNKQIAVHYVLDSKQAVDVTLQYSVDYGRTWFDCKSVTGDLQAQTTGRKTILWDCRKDGFENGSLLFNVVLTPKSVLRATYKKSTIGLALGIGSLWTTMEPKTQMYGDIGLGWTLHFSPFIGWDVLSINLSSPYPNYHMLCRVMTGVSVYTPTFIKHMKGYAAFKVGYGESNYATIYDYYHAGEYRWDYPGNEYCYKLAGAGFMYELEMGLQLTKRYFIGLTYRAHKVSDLYPAVPWDYWKEAVPVSLDYFHNFVHFASLRMGFNF